MYQTMYKQYKLQVDRVSVKEREEDYSILSIEGRINGLEFTATHALREGRDEPDGEFKIGSRDYKLSDEERIGLLEAILILLDENEDSTMVREMGRICGD